MSASQLLRILQTLPACANDEICTFNTDELEASMNKSSRYTNPFLSDEENNKVKFWNNPELEGSIFGIGFTNNHEAEKFRKSSAACSVPSHLFEKNIGFYIDKSSVECELPELIVCYKESDFHVKDICIDEGIPDEETILIDKDNDEVLCNSVPVNGDDDMIEAILDTEFLKHERLRPSSVTDCYKDAELKSSVGYNTVQNAADNYGSHSSTHTCEEKLNSSTDLQDDVSTEQLASNSMFSLQQDYVDQQPLQGSVQEFLKRAIVGSEPEKLGRSQTTNILTESKMERSFAINFDTGKLAMGSDPCGAMNPESVPELPLETQSALNNQDVASGNVAMANQMQYGGESSFSMAGVISELITCSRPIAFSGSISIRSDSSTTSTKSFAFPT